MRFLLCLILCQACGSQKPGHKPAPTVNPLDELASETAVYMDLAGSSSLDAYGFVSQYSHCDSLLFTSLYGAAGGPVDITKAKNPATGLYERHPAFDCHGTISKDMLIGLMTYLWHAKARPEVESVIKAGEDHNWVMGEGPASEVVLSPGLIATLYEIRFRLGGADALGRQVPQVEAKGLTGFQAHLQVLHILLRGSLLGGITADQLDRLSEQAQRQPRNGLFQAAYHRYAGGDQTSALALWHQFCPRGHLPTTADRCDDYLWQRDDKPGDWDACPKVPELTYSGVDCLVLSGFLRGMLD